MLKCLSILLITSLFQQFWSTFSVYVLNCIAALLLVHFIIMTDNKLQTDRKLTRHRCGKNGAVILGSEWHNKLLNCFHHVCNNFAVAVGLALQPITHARVEASAVSAQDSSMCYYSGPSKRLMLLSFIHLLHQTTWIHRGK